MGKELRKRAGKELDAATVGFESSVFLPSAENPKDKVTHPSMEQLCGKCWSAFVVFRL